MNSLAEIQKYAIERRPDGLIVDTNVLILYLVGIFDRNFIDKCGMLTSSNKHYSVDDFELLSKIISIFKKVVITPQIIAELSNISTSQKGITGNNLCVYFQKIIDFLKSAEEYHQKIECLWNVKVEVISRLGFTDLTLFELSRQKNLAIITDDLAFYLHSVKTVPIIKLGNVITGGYQSAFSNVR